MAEMLVRCTECGREAHPDSHGALRDGWPKCCGYTMRLESAKEFVAAIEARNPFPNPVVADKEGSE